MLGIRAKKVKNGQVLNQISERILMHSIFTEAFLGW